MLLGMLNYLAEEVMYLVRADVMRETVRPSIVPIHSGELTADVVPRAVGVPRHADVHVVQERHHYQP